jgi:hypothetical protein
MGWPATMPEARIWIGYPFVTVRVLKDLERFAVDERTIVVNSTLREVAV